MGTIGSNIHDIIVSPLKRIENEKGDLFHVMKNHDLGYSGFGEVYLSTINHGDIKAWKWHREMVSNIVVPNGKVKFVVADLRDDSPSRGMIDDFVLCADNYFRLTIPPGLWYGFMGLGENSNMIINVASIPHDPNEQMNKEIDFINYKW